MRAVSLTGILMAFLLFLRAPQRTQSLVHTPLGTMLHRLWSAGWGFDWLDNELIVRPFVWLANLDQNDAIDLVYQGIAWFSKTFHRVLSRTQTGQIRWYAVGIVVGTIVVIGMAVFL